MASAYQLNHEVTWFKDVLYVSFKQNSDESDKGVFIFSYGAAVMWGLTPKIEASVLTTVRRFEEHPYDTVEKEALTYSYGNRARVVHDQIILPSQDLKDKLAFSHALAQSIKLSVFEQTVRKTITETKTIPENLSKYGKISLSRKGIRKKMGKLFLERSFINLHLDVLDTPEYFWEHADLEPLYTMIVKYLDLEPRAHILNKRLDLIHDLFEVLGNELNHQHSSFLEWIIILLIAIELVASFVR